MSNEENLRDIRNNMFYVSMGVRHILLAYQTMDKFMKEGNCHATDFHVVVRAELVRKILAEPNWIVAYEMLVSLHNAKLAPKFFFPLEIVLNDAGRVVISTKENVDDLGPSARRP